MTAEAGPRVRFAPSPTGFLHVGGARTALFNWLLARREGGIFVLRIEDTDRERSSDAMVRAIVDGLAWLGMEADEGPVRQADGLERHREDALRLLRGGAAYRCFCSPEELEARRAEAERRGEKFFGYDRRCRSLDPGEAAARAAAGEPFAVRFAVPDGETAWTDLVHGPSSFSNEHLEDFVILRSDGTPVYNMAVVSDDLAMRITHVLRGDDHLSNTPKQLLIYRALNAEPPAFGHLPMILGPDGKRLSKRHGAVAVETYREEGILPEAMVNFLALLGWSPGDDREVLDPPELVRAFSLDRIVKKSAVFDPEKLRWLNGEHIRRGTPERLLGPVREAIAAAGLAPPEALDVDAARWAAILDVVKERGRTVGEVAAQAAPFLHEGFPYEEEAVRRFWKDREEAAGALRAIREVLEEAPSFEPEELERLLRERAERRGMGAGRLIHPLRVALLGVAVSPGIFTVLSLVGREGALRRIDRALGWLDARAATEA